MRNFFSGEHGLTSSREEKKGEGKEQKDTHTFFPRDGATESSRGHTVFASPPMDRETAAGADYAAFPKTERFSSIFGYAVSKKDSAGV